MRSMANATVRYGMLGFGAVAAVIVLIFVLRIEVPMWAMAVLAVAAMVALLLPVMYVKRTAAEFDGGAIHITGSSVDETIPLGSIRSFELRDKLTVGSAVKGQTNGWMVGGTFTNQEFGDYLITADCDAKAFVVVRYSGKVLVFNLRTEEQTKEFYELVKPKIPENPHRRRRGPRFILSEDGSLRNLSPSGRPRAPGKPRKPRP